MTNTPDTTSDKCLHMTEQRAKDCPRCNSSGVNAPWIISRNECNALIAAAYEDAARMLENRGSDGWAEHFMAAYASVNAEAIRESIPDDAIAAHERAVREAVEAERERCARLADFHLSLVHPHDPDSRKGDRVAQGYGNAALNIAAAIRAGDAE